MKTARAAVSVSPLEGPPAFHQITAARLNILYLIKDSSSRAIQTEKSTRVMKRAKNTRPLSLKKKIKKIKGGAPPPKPLCFYTFGDVRTWRRPRGGGWVGGGGL